ncbi:MAG: toprim domain-containing protein, partial [Chloroflexota bacterium]
LRPGTPKHLYLPGPHRGVWNAEGLQAAKEVILCEALIDALTFWCAGHRNVTTSYGVHGFTDDHLAAFKKFGVEKILVAYDRDDAGDRAAIELAPKLAEAGLDVSRVLFPRGTDANDFGREKGDFAALLRGAEFMAKGKRSLAVPDPALRKAILQASDREASACEASPLAAPSHAAEQPSLTASQDQVDVTFGDRVYRVRGLARNTSPELLRVNLRISKGDAYHVDTFDLLSARPRDLFVKQAALELSLKPEIVKKDLGKLLFELEILQEKRIQEALAPTPKAVAISEPERAEAMELLSAPDLLDRIARDFERIGIVGEKTNALVGYLAAVSRKMDEPLALLIQSNSAAGKSTLMEAILELAPPEDVERFTAMTGQSLFYMAESDLAHRILAIAEIAGAEKAGYAIKMLQSEGRISIATTVKDPDTGDLKTKRHDVQGPVAVMMTTTEAQVDEELQNRAIILTVAEDRAQTRAIHEAQRRRETLEGMLARAERQAVYRLHRNAQRLLKPLLVVNPFAPRLGFSDIKLRARRDHAKYLTLIRAIALLHQYQRPVKHVERSGKTIPYLEVAPPDIAIANRLAGEVLGRSLDELAPPTRRLLTLLDEFVRARTKTLSLDREDFRFTRREAREWTKWGHSQLAVHLDRLAE